MAEQRISLLPLFFLLIKLNVNVFIYLECLRLHNPHLRQVAVLFGIIEPVADDEFVRNLNAAVVDGNVGEAAGGLAENGADADAGGFAEGKELPQMLQGQTGVDHILHQKDMFAADVGFDVFFDGDDAA